MIRTKAVKAEDGAYRITGEKIWISGGEEDLAPNIVQLVLARVEGAPAGTRGLSLFITPKFLPKADGTPGERNAYRCAGLEEKMGIHGNATCVMAYEGATGWLLGEENMGPAADVVMMNEARLGVAVQGLAQAETSYQAAVAFARDRLQGRALTGPRTPMAPADSILVHPDVRRMLMESRAIVEGGRALLFWTFLHEDLAHAAADEAERTRADDVVALLTPVVKSFLTDRGFKACSDALQVHGGSGYTVHFPAAQYLRDSRIAMIYEGTNGVQALDLVGRKIGHNGGRALQAFLGELDAFTAEAGEGEAAPFVEAVKGAKAQLQEASIWMLQHAAEPDFGHRRLTRLPEPDGAHRPGLHVGEDRQGRAGEDRGGERRSVLCRQAGHRPLLPRPHPPRRGRAPGQGEGRRRLGDGVGGRGVLAPRPLLGEREGAVAQRWEGERAAPDSQQRAPQPPTLHTERGPLLLPQEGAKESDPVHHIALDPRGAVGGEVLARGVQAERAFQRRVHPVDARPCARRASEQVAQGYPFVVGGVGLGAVQGAGVPHGGEAGPAGQHDLAHARAAALAVAIGPDALARRRQVVGEHGAAQAMAVLQQEQRRVVRAHLVQIDVQGDEVGLAVLVVDQVLMEVDAVEIGDVAIFGRT